jgi:hypothetical protein
LNKYILTDEDIEELQLYCDKEKERSYYDFEFKRCDELKDKLERLRKKDV